MRNLAKDPLMSGTRGLLAVLFWIFVVSGVLAILLAPVMAINADMITANLEVKAEIAGEEVIDPRFLALTIFIGGVLMGVLAWFISMLRRIVATVAEGDPFVVENAQRLTRMGWLAVAIGVLATGIGIAATLIDGSPEAFDIDGGSLILALSLFILARVFRHGAALREDLEGTV